MDNVVSATSAGLNSLSGFSFQIKVFILMMTRLSNGQCVEFETLDDVVVKDIRSSESVHDSCIKTREAGEGKIVAFQVKQTKVTDATARQILYNWMIALNENPQIGCFELLLDEGYSLTSKVFSNSAEKEFDMVKNSDKDEKALVTRVKKIYKDDLEAFKKDFNYICANYSWRILNNIDQLIANELCLPFHSSLTDAAKPHFNKRIEELFTRVCARIIECAGKRIPYKCSFAEYLQLCEEICRNISEEQYNPDYESFKTVYMAAKLEETVKCTREYKQLGYCRLTDSALVEHLRWEQYYQNIRQHYLADAKKTQINITEDVAYRNFSDVVMELQANDKDAPNMRLIQTKRQLISTLSEEYSRWGAYVFLTRDEAEQQISWKDEEDECRG